MEDSKDRASKADVQTTPGNKMPAPELDTESAAEIVYGSEDDEVMEERSALGEQQS